MPTPYFRIELLPAKEGDAIWVEYGDSEYPRRILIDGGPIAAYPAVEAKLNSLPRGDQRIELVVITHVDTDHIEGIIRYFAEKPQNWKISPRDIWFNGYHHMKANHALGGREGDFLSALIQLRAPDKWNLAFQRNPAMVLADRDLPSNSLEDGMKWTLLSPDIKKLKRMSKRWEKDVAKHDLRPGDLERALEQLLDMGRYRPAEGILGAAGVIDQDLLKQLKTDQSAANGSSIALLLEFNGKTCLMLGDAHASTVADSIEKLIPDGQKRLKIDAVKVSHHGSKSNITKRLMTLIDAKHYLISTNGDRHEHPNPQAVEVIIQGSIQDPVLWFNYRSENTLPWRPELHPELRPYTAMYPEEGQEGITLNLFEV